ncbi:MAG: serine/threonine-protein kinase [Pyrinomonadaceae bacterium]
MNTLTQEKKMLYCPKCKREYEDGTQRFCNNDGVRLLPSVNSGHKRNQQDRGVFTSLLGRSNSPFEKDEKVTPKPSMPRRRNEPPVFENRTKAPVFKAEKIIAHENKPKQRDVKPPQRFGEAVRPSVAAEKAPDVGTKASTEVEKPISRLIDPREIGDGRAKLGDRKITPVGRNAMILGDPARIVGETFKGRYRIGDVIGQDGFSIAYAAEDSILKGKQVVVRVLTPEKSGDELDEKMLVEERVALSHIDHPNVAKVVDSGEIQEGFHFIVTVESRANSVDALLRKNGGLNPQRVGRIVRQASYALSEVHQNGILHRNLKPENILLTISEAGIEQVKVTDFCLSDGKVDEQSFRFRAPEQLGGQFPTFASDSYALAVIAYLLLTKRFPFAGSNVKEILAAQKSGSMAKASELNPLVSPDVDSVLKRALAFDPSDRYPKARDFGEALFAALAVSPSAEEETAVTEPVVAESVAERLENAETAPSTTREVASDLHIASTRDDDEIDVDELEDDALQSSETARNEVLWKNRSPEPLLDRGTMWTGILALGLLAVLLSVIGVYWYFLTKVSKDEVVTSIPSSATSTRKSNEIGVDSSEKGEALASRMSDTPPAPRDMEAPKDFEFFENSKLKLSEKLAAAYRPFSIYYPKTWKQNLVDFKKDKVDDKFLDISLNAKDGVPIEQMIISPYESRGTYAEDTELFPKLVENSNKEVANSMGGSYEVVREGATTIQGGRWKAYQVNFELKGKRDDEPITVWGRRLWIPAQQTGAKNGFIVTMIATSRSEDVKSAEDVGRKGDLAKIIETFEPGLD